MSTKTQLETLLLRSNNFNNSDFQIQYFGVDIQPNNCNLYSNSLDIVIGENYYPEEGKWIISKNGECLGVFQNDREVINFKIPYADHLTIAKSLKYKPRINDLIFITLPTPKQELLSVELAKKFKDYKIIFIGGSIAIFSGEEKEVPVFLNNFEFLWRLQYETWRRIKRLLVTFCNVLFDYIWSQKIKKLNAQIK